MKAAALRHALTDRARHNRIHVVSGVIEGETPSTKAAKTLFGKIWSARTCSWSSTAPTRPRGCPPATCPRCTSWSRAS